MLWNDVKKMPGVFRGIALLFLLLTMYAPAPEAQVYTWVDENGVKNYGDTIPYQYRKNADPANINIHTPSEEEIKAAQKRNKDIRNYNKKAVQKKSKNQGTKKSVEKVEGKESPRISEYDRKMAAYKESEECFSSCRIKNPDKQVYVTLPNGSGYYRTLPGGYDNSLCGHCKPVSKPSK